MRKSLFMLVVMTMVGWQCAYASRSNIHIDAAFCPRPPDYACCKHEGWAPNGVMWVAAPERALNNARDVDNACSSIAGARWNLDAPQCTHDTPVFRHGSGKISSECIIIDYP